MNGEPRNNRVGLTMGLRGTGKTLFVLGSKFSAKASDKALNKTGLVEVALSNGFKVLIIDTMDHPSYRNIPILTPQAFKAWKQGTGRIVLKEFDVKNLVTHINNSPHINNTFIVFEDAGKYTEAKLPLAFKALIAESKQRNIDLLFMYHCWADTPRDIFRKGLDWIQLFKTEDSILERKDNLRLFDKINAAYEEVKKNSSIFYGKYIDTRTD